jgi:rod shape-determining protein MreB
MAYHSNDIGIDLGTANVLVFVKDKGIIANEPSVVAFNALTGDILAVGNKAYEMIGRTPKNIITVKPLKNGVIADYNTTKIMLKYFITKALKGLSLVKPRVLISVPLGITQVEKKAVMEAAKQAGAREAYLIREPIAAAIGAGLPVKEARGSMVINIGGGTSEVAIISLGGIVVGKSLRLGGDALNQAIIRGIKKLANLEIGNRTAEKIKTEIGYAIDPPPQTKYLVKGRNLATGLPTTMEIDAEKITEVLTEPLQTIIEAIHTALERTPPELAADIMQMGITLTGGGALLKNLDQAIKTINKIPVNLANSPLTCVADGIGQVFKDERFLQKLITR